MISKRGVHIKFGLEVSLKKLVKMPYKKNWLKYHIGTFNKKESAS